MCSDSEFVLELEIVLDLVVIGVAGTGDTDPLVTPDLEEVEDTYPLLTTPPEPWRDLSTFKFGRNLFLPIGARTLFFGSTGIPLVGGQSETSFDLVWMVVEEVTSLVEVGSGSVPLAHGFSKGGQLSDFGVISMGA